MNELNITGLSVEMDTSCSLSTHPDKGPVPKRKRTRRGNRKIKEKVRSLVNERIKQIMKREIDTKREKDICNK